MHLELAVLFAVLFISSLFILQFIYLFIFSILFTSWLLIFHLHLLITNSEHYWPEKKKVGSGRRPWSRRCRHFLILLMYQSITYAIYSTNSIKEALKQPQLNVWMSDQIFQYEPRWKRWKRLYKQIKVQIYEDS